MSTRANPTVIGAFVVGATLLLGLALLVWGGAGFLHTKLEYVMFFDSAVTGLQKGAPVMFRGVRVGEVTDVQIRWGTPLVAVYVALEPDSLKGVPRHAAPTQLQQAIDKGLRAQLRTQSVLTGVLFVALDAAPGTPVVLRGLDPKTPELPTIPTNVEVWMAKLERVAETVANLPLADIARAATEALDQTSRILKSPEIVRALRNTDSLVNDTRTLVRKIDTLTSTITGQVGPLATDARATLTSAQAAVTSAQTALADVPRLVDDARRLIVKVDGHADPLLASLQRSSEAAQATLDQARTTLGGVDGVLNQDAPLGYELGQLLRETREMAQALRSLADYLERVPDAPVYGVRRTGGKP